MFYHLFSHMNKIDMANLTHNTALRSIAAILSAFLISLFIGKWTIKKFQLKEIGQYIREEGPSSHHSKAGTPTMGGLFIIFSLIISSILWVKLNNIQVWIGFISILGFGAIGFTDDWLKQTKKNNAGLSPGNKFILQILFALLASILIYLIPDFDTKLSLPFFKDMQLDLGLGYIFFSSLVIIAASNAVNLTDGLDGLVTGPLIVSFISFMILIFIAGNKELALYFNLSFVKDAGELSIVCGALTGAALGFLWFNSYPAQIFMGDVGSLALGAFLGLLAILSKQELLLIIIGGVFVVEALSVILQVSYFKITKGKRIFRMAPIHHHFEIKGTREPKLTIRFWIISLILAFIGLSSLVIG